MPFLDFFRNFFTRGLIQDPPQNSFRNSMWQNDEDEDDINDFRQPMSKYHFGVDFNPFEMTRFFESQMDNLLRSFFANDGFGKNFGDNSSLFVPFGDEDFTRNFVNPDGSSNKGPRDEVMKPHYEQPNSIFGFDAFTNMFSIPDHKNTKNGLCDDLLKPSYEMPDSRNQKVDSDIDGKFKSDELAQIWKNPDSIKPVEPQLPTRNFSYGKSVSIQIIRRPDGSIEERRTVKDSNGNNETTIRQIDEHDGFNEKKRFESPKLPFKSLEDDFPWDKLFGTNPKL